jgi:ABC-type phosphate/phosphonate transport system substrate-binding protein
MIASLAMYDFGAAVAANDRFWALIREGLRERGIDAPERLTRGDAAFWPAWEAPDLLLSQTCGYPYRARLHDRVAYVGTPDYGVEGCPPGHYRSVFVVRADDSRQSLAEFDGARFAFNEDLSQSGWAAPQIHAARLGVRLPPALRTGGHRRSAQAVADGRADIAALDAVTHRLLLDNDAALAARIRVIARTEPTPGLPLITARDGPAGVLRLTVGQAIAALAAEDRQALHLKKLISIPAAAYLAVPNPPPPEALRRAD